jgi:hypothetical protein
LKILLAAWAKSKPKEHTKNRSQSKRPYKDAKSPEIKQEKRVIGKDTTLKIPSIGTFSKPETLLRKFPQIFASNSSNFEK